MNKWLYCGWGVLYVVCVALGLIQDTTPIVRIALLIISIIFFLPGAMLLYNGIKQDDRKTVLRIRWLSIASLALTLLGLIALFFCAASGNETALDLAFEALLVVSAPMICSQYWVVSLFLWACLLSASFFKKRPPDQR